MIVTTLVTLTTANVDIVYRDMVTGNHQVGTAIEFPIAACTDNDHACHFGIVSLSFLC